jgi:DNA polymerase III subunit gamma/tau
MNTSLHTKFRPASFDNMVGQESLLKSIRKVVKDKRAKVFILVGPAGTGKTTTARILANMFAGGKASPANIVEIPAANLTGADAARSIIDKAISRAIGASPVKTIILDEAHRLSGQAWDVLLKATEEPPAHIYYVICTTNPDKIPKTIKTRGIEFVFHPYSEDELVEILLDVMEKEGITIEAEVVEVIAENSEGSARQALSNLEKCCYCETAADARRLMQKAGDVKEVVDLCRILVNPQKKPNWKEIQNCLKDLKEIEAESIRIVFNNYVASAALGSKSDKFTKHCLFLLDCFTGPYNSSEKFAPLLLSIGAAIGMDE